VQRCEAKPTNTSQGSCALPTIPEALRQCVLCRNADGGFRRSRTLRCISRRSRVNALTRPCFARRFESGFVRSAPDTLQIPFATRHQSRTSIPRWTQGELEGREVSERQDRGHHVNGWSVLARMTTNEREHQIEEHAIEAAQRGRHREHAQAADALLLFGSECEQRSPERVAVAEVVESLVGVSLCRVRHVLEA